MKGMNELTVPNIKSAYTTTNKYLPLLFKNGVYLNHIYSCAFKYINKDIGKVSFSLLVPTTFISF